MPSSGSQLVEFVPSGAMGQPPVGSQDTAQIGLASQKSIPSFRFNLWGVNVGVDSQPGEQYCEFIVSGYRFDATLGFEVRAMSQTKWIPTCGGTHACRLVQQDLSGFENLTSFLVSVKCSGQPRSFWMDDLRVGWTDNSCQAALTRQNTPERKGRRNAQGAKGYWKWTRDGVQHVEAGAAGAVARWVRRALGGRA